VRLWQVSQHQPERTTPCTKDFTNQEARRHKPLADREHGKNCHKSQIPANVDQDFLIIIKHMSGFAEMPYRGLVKNSNWLFVVAALDNFFMAHHHLFKGQGVNVSIEREIANGIKPHREKLPNSSKALFL